MRVLPAAALAALLSASGPAAAIAQSQPTALLPDNSVIAVPPAPAIVAAPPSPQTPAAPATPAPPGLVQANPPQPGDDGNADNFSPPNNDNGSAPAPGQPAPAGQADMSEDQDVIPTPPNTWQPGKFAEIGVLDKIDGGAKEISVPVGGQSVVGDLQINVLACVIRPPGQVPDAAIFLALQNTADPSAPPDYRGWLIRSAPGAAVAGDASEIFRVIDCTS